MVHFVFEPFDANHNNAPILKDASKWYEDKMNTIHEDDVILVDRDFQDVIKFLTNNKN